MLTFHSEKRRRYQSFLQLCIIITWKKNRRTPWLPFSISSCFISLVNSFLSRKSQDRTLSHLFFKLSCYSEFLSLFFLKKRNVKFHEKREHKIRFSLFHFSSSVSQISSIFSAFKSHRARQLTFLSSYQKLLSPSSLLPSKNCCFDLCSFHSFNPSSKGNTPMSFLSLYHQPVFLWCTRSTSSEMRPSLS